MKIYKVTCYPNVENYEWEGEAENIKEAILYAENSAHNNCYFMATKNDVEVLDNGDDDNEQH